MLQQEGSIHSLIPEQGLQDRCQPQGSLKDQAGHHSLASEVRTLGLIGETIPQKLVNLSHFKMEIGLGIGALTAADGLCLMELQSMCMFHLGGQ